MLEAVPCTALCFVVARCELGFMFQALRARISA